MAIHYLGLIAVAIFYLLILAVGVWAAWIKRRETKTSEQIIVASRNIGLFVGVLTMTATWVGGGFINGTAEKIYTHGLVWCQAPFGYTICITLGGIFFAGKMRDKNYVTMLDPFQKKYGDMMTALLYIPALFGDLCWSAAILSALGSTIRVITGLDQTLSIIVSAVIAVVYTIIGGLYSVAYTDVIQLFCIFLGLWLALPFALTHRAVSNIADTFPKWKGELVGTANILEWIDHAFLLMLGGIPWQVYFQRVLACKTSRRAEVLSYVASFGCVVLTMPALLIGSIAASTDWNQTAYPEINKTEDAQLILPLVLRYLCPEVVSFIGLGAVSAAVMSSSDSSILAASSMFAHNLYRPIYNSIHKNAPASAKHVIWVIRIAVLCVAVSATSIAITVKTTYGLWFLCSDFVYAALFPQLVCIIYIDFCNTYGALVGFILSMSVRLLSGEALISFPSAMSISYGFPYRTVSMLTGFVTIVLVSLITNFVFKRGYLPEHMDVFKCVVALPPSEEVEKEEAVTFMDNSIIKQKTNESALIN